MILGRGVFLVQGHRLGGGPPDDAHANTYMEALECSFLQEDFLKVFIQTSILNSFD